MPSSRGEALPSGPAKCSLRARIKRSPEERGVPGYSRALFAVPGARPVWDSNSSGSGQPTEIMEFDGNSRRYRVQLTKGATGLERGNSLQWKDLKRFGVSGWEAGIRTAQSSCRDGLPAMPSSRD
jgi:hypothetical protein